MSLINPTNFLFSDTSLFLHPYSHSLNASFCLNCYLQLNLSSLPATKLAHYYGLNYIPAEVYALPCEYIWRQGL